MAVLHTSVAAQNDAMDAVTALIDVGGAGTIKIYTGTIPATVATAASGSLLATLIFSATSFGASGVAGAGIATAAAITGDAGATGGGVAGYARIASGGGTDIMDVDITATGGGGTIELDNTTISAGATVDISNFMTLTIPSGV